jgi:hypothetical protein
MYYGWYSPKMAASVSDHKYAPLEREAPVGLSVYTAADGQYAVVASVVAGSADDSGTMWDDIVCYGPVGHHLGNLPFGMAQSAPIAVPIGYLYDFMTGVLSEEQTRLGEARAETFIDEARGLTSLSHAPR